MADEAVPRDMKIVHLILASMGITSYQEHVPLQLLDFAYRYTTQVFQDALIYSDYAHQSGASQPAGMGAQNAPLTVDDVKLAVSSRVSYQFKPTTPKDLLMSLAAERNKRSLPPVPSSYGLRLPPEKHCLTGRDRDVDGDDDVIIAGYEKINIGEPGQPEQGDMDVESSDNHEVKAEQAEQAEVNESDKENDDDNSASGKENEDHEMDTS